MSFASGNDTSDIVNAFVYHHQPECTVSECHNSLIPVPAIAILLVKKESARERSDSEVGSPVPPVPGFSPARSSEFMLQCVLVGVSCRDRGPGYHEFVARLRPRLCRGLTGPQSCEQSRRPASPRRSLWGTLQLQEENMPAAAEEGMES